MRRMATLAMKAGATVALLACFVLAANAAGPRTHLRAGRDGPPAASPVTTGTLTAGEVGPGFFDAIRVGPGDRLVLPEKTAGVERLPPELEPPGGEPLATYAYGPGRMHVYECAGSPASLEAFFATRLAAAGWKRVELEGPALEASMYRREGALCRVHLAPGERAGTSVATLTLEGAVR